MAAAAAAASASASAATAAATKSPTPSLWKSPALLLLTLILPISISLVLYNQPEGYNPIPIAAYSFDESIRVPYTNDRIVAVSERIGDGLLPGPEDFAYDAESGFLYASCADGWIRRVKVGDGEPIVEDWARVGGRPLGLVLGSDGSLIVAESEKGLLLVKADKEVQLLTDEAEGVKFRLTDGVDVTSDGLIYFTDASYKYNVHAALLDILEGRPHGRLLSFDPSTNQTVVLLRDLYFANGAALSPDQQSLIFCETVVRRCQRYHIRGEKKGTVETFVENLPGFPDNIRYDGEGHYWIALAMGRTRSWDMLMKYPFLRKISAVLGKYVLTSEFERDSGVLSVNLEGKPIAHYSDPSLYTVTVGLKIGKHLYHGSLSKPYISRIDLTQFDSHAK